MPLGLGGCARPRSEPGDHQRLLPSTLVARRRFLRRSDLEATHAREHAGGVVPVWRADPRHAGRRLRQLREAAGLSQLALAAASGLTHKAISILEHGRRTPHGRTVRHLAARLDVPPRRVQRWLREGQMAGTKVAGRWHVPAVAVAELDRSDRLRGASRRLDPRFTG